MKKRKSNLPVNIFILSVIIIVVFTLVLGYIRSLFITSDYFNVVDIVSNEKLNVDLSYLKGRNIFAIDLDKESGNIGRYCPDCLKVRIARVLPNRLFVEFVKRHPVAMVKLHRSLLVDQYGMLFSNTLTPSDAELPLITGLEAKLSGAVPGRRYDIKELSLALNIIREFRKSPVMRNFQIKRIDIEAANDVTIYMPLGFNNSSYSKWQAPERQNILEVRISQGNIVEKVAVISGLINQERSNLNNIKYIDLRFKEPVINFKDAK